MSILNKVKPVVEKFKKENPKCGKIEYTGSDRTAQEELDFILERPTQYPLIRNAFESKFKCDLPSEKSATKDQCNWCLDFIMEHAGKAGAYAHVGGKAQDVWVADLDADMKEKLSKALQKAGLKVLNEKVSGKDSKYGVSTSAANVLHVYVD